MDFEQRESGRRPIAPEASRQALRDAGALLLLIVVLLSIRVSPVDSDGQAGPLWPPARAEGAGPVGETAPGIGPPTAPMVVPAVARPSCALDPGPSAVSARPVIRLEIERVDQRTSSCATASRRLLTSC